MLTHSTHRAVISMPTTLTPLQELAKSLHNCQRCKLAKMGRTQVAFGGSNPQGLTQRYVERDYMECEYKARFANPQQFYNQGSPFPFSAGSQSPADHARALHGLSTINAMRDTCLAAKGYRVE